MRNGGYYFALKKEGSNRELNLNFGVARNDIASCNIAKLILHNALCNTLYNVFFFEEHVYWIIQKLAWSIQKVSD